MNVSDGEITLLMKYQRERNHAVLRQTKNTIDTTFEGKMKLVHDVLAGGMQHIQAHAQTVTYQTQQYED